MKRSKTNELSQRPAATVNLIGGRLCLDFVNSVGARRTGASGAMVIRDEKLNDFIDVIAWSRHAGVFDDAEIRALLERARRAPRAAKKAFHALLELRESLYRILKTTFLGRRPDTSDLMVFNRAVQRACAARRIVIGRKSFDWQWGGGAVSLDLLSWLVTESAVEFVTTGDLSRLSQCGGDDCGWLFEDVTRNHSRHWCDTRDCGNRERVRRFRRKSKPEAR